MLAPVSGEYDLSRQLTSVVGGVPDTLIIAPAAAGDHPSRARQQAEPVHMQLPVVSQAQPPRVERGKGRVHVNILGNCNRTFNDPLFRVLVFRAIAWAAKEPVDPFNDLVTVGAKLKRQAGLAVGLAVRAAFALDGARRLTRLVWHRKFSTWG